MAIKWGNTITGTKDSRQGKIGIDVSVSTTSTSTTATVTVKTYFASKYSLSDVNNKYYYNGNSTSATTLIGAVDISHPVDTGSGWDSKNQTQLGSSTYTITKTTSKQTKYYAAKITGLDNLGSSNVSSVYGEASIPALTSYAVTYNANGGSGAPSKQTKWYGTDLTLSTTTPKRDGHTFKGWGTTATDTSVNYAAGAKYTSNAKLDLYAIWTPNTYTVTYNANGGSGAPGNQTKTYGVALPLSSTVPTRANYNFKGWGTTASATTVSYAPGASYTSNAKLDLYAIWELAYAKPKIAEYSVSRCDSNGVPSDNGTYALVNFNWSCEKELSAITIEWGLANSSELPNSFSIDISNINDMSGSVTNQIIGNDDFSVEYTYDVKVTVADINGSTPAYATLQGAAFPIDVYRDGTGIAFGKPAETSDLMDVNFNAKFNKSVTIGNATLSYDNANSCLVISFN